MKLVIFFFQVASFTLFVLSSIHCQHSMEPIGGKIIECFFATHDLWMFVVHRNLPIGIRYKE